MTITLPKEPNGHQYEEAMAAAVRSIGYFTETRTILDHDGREVLELDVVASPATEAFAAKILLDAKKSSAGFSDIFKIYGWRVFLKIPKGCIVHGVAAEPPALAAFKEVCPKLDVYAEHFDIEKDVEMATVPILNKGAEEKLRHIARLIGWYQLIAERLCVREFQDLKKKHQGEEIFARVQKYRRACQLAFFESDPLKRAELLYQAFKDDAHLSGAVVEWQAKQEGKDPSAIWEAVRDSAAYPWLQYVVALETKARILIIKNGLEAALDDASSDTKMEAFWKGFKLALLPSNFQTGFERLSASKHRHGIPYILQLYVELFGGFFVDDLDREHLAALAGQPVEAVAEALEILDVFYPIEKGWHTTSKELRMLKMVPAYLRGIGAFFRETLRGLKNYSEIAPKMGWLIGKWHNAALAILARELAVKEEAAKPAK
jgi:hypothetical protein